MPKKKTKDKKIERITELITDGKIDKALELADVSNVEDLLGVGVLFGQNKVHDVAEKIFDRVIQLNPNLADVWNNKGIVFGNLGKYNEAVKCYDEAIKINPNYDKAWNNKGIVFGNLGKYDEAVKCYDEAIKISPNNADAWYNKGIVFGNLGKYDEEVKCYDEVIKINPNYDKAWNNKGIVFGNLGKYDEAVKCYDEAIKINPNYADVWYNKGIVFGNLGKYDEAVKCYDEAIKINPNLVEAWYTKGIVFGNLGKYDEAVKCYDEAIKINPNYAEAWNNKGIVFGNLGKYNEAVKCYDEAIKINPNYVEAYGNKGIIFLNAHRYDEAKVELKTARELFSEKRLKNDANKAGKLELLAINASKLVPMLEPLDRRFTNCLDSQSLTELKENSLKISKDVKTIIKKFEKRKIPEDTIHLLISKKMCFTAISNALKFEEVDLKKLRDTEEVFDKWKLPTLAMAVGSLVLFIRGIRKYSRLEDIPKDVEAYLLRLLKATDVLDGKLTKEITKGKPFAAKPTDVEKKPEIKYVQIGDTGKDQVRVCLVQLNFSLTERFPYRLKEKEKTKRKIFEALRIAKNEKVDIICFPELSFVEEWIEEIKKNYKEMMIICGTYYDDNDRNICQIIIDGRDYSYAKCNCSIMEEPNGRGLKKGNKLFIFQTKYGLISVITCVDFDENWYDIKDFVKQKNKQLNFIINSRLDIDKEHNFQRKSSLDIDLPDGSRKPTITLHINAAHTKWGRYEGGGGTTIIGSEHVHRIEKYTQDGLRPRDDIKYKLCQAKGEMMLIADLKIEQTTEKRTEMNNWYKYYNGRWDKLGDKCIWV